MRIWMARTTARGTGRLSRMSPPQANAYAMVGRLHASAASYQSRHGHRYCFTGIQRRQICRCYLDGLERTAHVVPQHSKQQVTSLIHLHSKKVDRFRKCLINGLVETDDIIRMWDIRLTVVRPKA